jgi:hypothetical protein
MRVALALLLLLSTGRPLYAEQCVLHIGKSQDETITEILRLDASMAGVEVCQGTVVGAVEKTYGLVSTPLPAAKGVCTYTVRRLFLGQDGAQKIWTFTPPKGSEDVAEPRRKMKLVAGTVCPPPDSEYVRVFRITGGVFFRLFQFGANTVSTAEKFDETTELLPDEMKKSEDFIRLREAVRTTTAKSGVRITGMTLVDELAGGPYYAIELQRDSSDWTLLVDFSGEDLAILGFGAGQP